MPLHVPAARIDWETVGVIAFIAGPVFGPGAAITYVIYRVADVVGSQTVQGDLLPDPPPNLPLPRFLRTKPYVMLSLIEQFRVRPTSR